MIKQAVTSGKSPVNFPKNIKPFKAKKVTSNRSGNSGISGGISFGKDQNKAWVPIILAIGTMLFLVFTFGGLFRR